MKKLIPIVTVLAVVTPGMLTSCGVTQNNSEQKSKVEYLYNWHNSSNSNPKNGDQIEFTIPMGTGENGWNDESSMVEVSVGDSLIIRNDDSVTHQLHTSGAPCDHGDAIDPGERWTCEIGRVYDPDVDLPIYDHLVGRSARFWLRAVGAPSSEPSEQVPAELYTDGETTASFELMELDTIYEQDTIALAIPDNGGAVFHEFQLEATGFIDEIQLQIRITHTYIGDLILKLVSPDGTEVTLHDRMGGSTDNMDVIWGPGGVELEALLDLSGKEVYGTWKFSIEDMARADVGTFDFIKLGMSRTFR